MIKGLFSRATMAIILVSAAAAQAGIYKWQDEDGTWHFSETPPISQTAEKISVKTLPPSSETAQQADNKEPQKQDGAAETLPLSPEIVAEEKARKAENCRRAKENLQNLRSGERIRYRDEAQGEVRYLSAEERQEWKAKAQKSIAEDCN